jgi:hypothetical protein
MSWWGVEERDMVEQGGKLATSVGWARYEAGMASPQCQAAMMLRFGVVAVRLRQVVATAGGAVMIRRILSVVKMEVTMDGGMQ